MAGVIARAGEREPAQVLVTEVESALSRIPPARIRTKAGLGFEATIVPNTTSGLADEGKNLDGHGRVRGNIINEGVNNLVLISVSISAGS